MTLRSRTTSPSSSWKGKATATAPPHPRETIIPLPAPLAEAGILGITLTLAVQGDLILFPVALKAAGHAYKFR